jgi:hypothetical protein
MLSDRRQRVKGLLVQKVRALAVGVEIEASTVSRSGSLNFSCALKVLSKTAA